MSEIKDNVENLREYDLGGFGMFGDAVTKEEIAALFGMTVEEFWKPVKAYAVKGTLRVDKSNDM